MLSETGLNRRGRRGFRGGRRGDILTRQNDHEIESLCPPKLSRVSLAVGDKCSDLRSGASSQDRLSPRNVAAEYAFVPNQHQYRYSLGPEDQRARFSNA